MRRRRNPTPSQRIEREACMSNLRAFHKEQETKFMECRERGDNEGMAWHLRQMNGASQRMRDLYW